MGFQYQLSLGFDGEACRHSFLMRCIPGDTLRQRVVSAQVMLSPETPFVYGTDGFGNRTIEGTVQGTHDSFSVSVQGTVEVPSGEPEAPVPECHEEGDEAMVYRYHTRRTEPGPSIESFLSSAPDCACDDLSRAVGLMHRLHSSFKYEKGVTGPESTDRRGGEPRLDRGSTRRDMVRAGPDRGHRGGSPPRQGLPGEGLRRLPHKQGRVLRSPRRDAAGARRGARTRMKEVSR